jgi:hypothetical protein
VNLKQQNGFANNVPGGIGLILLACAIGLLFFYEQQYEVIQRPSMFLNAPISLLLVSFLIACGLIVMLAVLVRRYIPYPPFSERPALWISVLLWFPLFLNVVAVGLLLNGALDNSNVTRHQPTIIYKGTGNYKGRRIWQLHIRDWRNSEEIVYLSVNQTFFEAHAVGSKIEVSTRNGVFGYEWLVDYK